MLLDDDFDTRFSPLDGRQMPFEQAWKLQLREACKLEAVTFAAQAGVTVILLVFLWRNRAVSTHFIIVVIGVLMLRGVWGLITGGRDIYAMHQDAKQESAHLCLGVVERIEYTEGSSRPFAVYCTQKITDDARIPIDEAIFNQLQAGDTIGVCMGVRSRFVFRVFTASELITFQ